MVRERSAPWCVPMKQKDNQSVSLSMLREEEKPYEKCARNGPSSLTEVELLSVILRTGSEGVSVIEMSRDLMDSFRSEGISGLCSATQTELMKVRGIGKVKAMQLVCIAELSRRIAKSVKGDSPCFRTSADVAEYYMEDFRHQRQELAVVVMLDTRGRLLGEEVISSGSVNNTVVTPREIFLRALESRAVSVILIHNHPSGDPNPSQEDILLTRQVKDAGDMIGIPLLDHIIIGDRRAVSMAPMIYSEEEQSGDGIAVEIW